MSFLLKKLSRYLSALIDCVIIFPLISVSQLVLLSIVTSPNYHYLTLANCNLLFSLLTPSACSLP